MSALPVLKRVLHIKKIFSVNPNPCGWVYDFRNFEEVNLCNGLSSELQNSCIPQKTSREYILLSTLNEKWRFWQFIGQNVRKTARFLAVFGYFIWL